MSYTRARQNILDELPSEVRELMEASSDAHASGPFSTVSDLRQSAIVRLLDGMPNEVHDIQHECRAVLDTVIDLVVYSAATCDILAMEKQQQALFEQQYQRLREVSETAAAPPPLSSFFVESSSCSSKGSPTTPFSSTTEWAPKAAVVEKGRSSSRRSFAFNSSVADLLSTLQRTQLDTIRAERAESIIAAIGTPSSQVQAARDSPKPVSNRPFRF